MSSSNPFQMKPILQNEKLSEATYKNTSRLSHKASKVIRNISVLERLEDELSENTIKYTNKTQEIREEPVPRLFSSPSELELLNIKEIRQYESIASERREHVNY